MATKFSLNKLMTGGYMLVSISDGEVREHIQSPAWKPVSDYLGRLGMSQTALNNVHQEVDTEGNARLVI